MEKEATTVYRRHRPGAGPPPLGVATGHPKGTSEGAELQRSQSMGSLHQKGDPPSGIQKPSKDLGRGHSQRRAPPARPPPLALPPP